VWTVKSISRTGNLNLLIHWGMFFFILQFLIVYKID
jgi:hypothetical protein